MLNTINDDNISLKSLEDSYCSVCLSSLNDNISKLSCNHSFHTNCINEWFKVKDSCPLCRTCIIKPNLDVLPPLINRDTPRPNYNKSNFAIICYILILFNFCSNFYLDYNISESNTHINKLLMKNQTLLDLQTLSEYNSFAILIIIDIFYMVIYYHAASYLLINTTPNFRCILTILIAYCMNIATHPVFILDTLKNMDNDIYEFSKKKKYDFTLSIILYSSSLFLKTVCITVYLKVYINNN